MLLAAQDAAEIKLQMIASAMIAWATS